MQKLVLTLFVTSLLAGCSIFGVYKVDIPQGTPLTKAQASQVQVGIFGIKVETDAVLHAGDRVEVYRPLTINPKDIRRKRAAKNPVGRYIKGNRFKQSAQ
ncbi:RnfH family protein [Acinetobacter baumannii]|uniref:RnfH family protein n=1 Tax=Acinetobacter baumannii TaxID=470 RepID=UPI000B5490D0|nr:RnfH family protein [Acinetobacter baumannii]